MDVPKSTLQHIYFFVQDKHSDIDNQSSVTPTATPTKKSRHGSHTPSLGSTSTDSSFTPSTPSGSSDMNPLAKTFTPRSKDKKRSKAPTKPSTMFETRMTSDKGLGLFATTFIPLGTRLMCEEPLLKIPSNELHLVWGTYCRLGNAQKAAFDSMHSFKPEGINFEQASCMHLIDPTDTSLDKEDVEELVADQIRVMSIFAVNNMQNKPKGLGVYTVASRINHSCLPTVHHSYNPNLKRLTVHAIVDIHPGQELTTTYLGEPGYYMARNERVAALRAGYGFTCTCPACSDRTSTSDGRRLLMNSIAWGLQQFHESVPPTSPFIPGNSVAAMKQAEDLITAMLMEGVVSIELTKAYRMASVVAVKLEDYDKALEYAHDEAVVERNCLGTDLDDLKKLGVATESWMEQILKTIRSVGGEAMEKHYMSIVGDYKLSKNKVTGGTKKQKTKAERKARQNAFNGA